MLFAPLASLRTWATCSLDRGLASSDRSPSASFGTDSVFATFTGFALFLGLAGLLPVLLVMADILSP
jgi:hypothetical protein